jgi:iron(III) transport system ATP-binding protein
VTDGHLQVHGLAKAFGAHVVVDGLDLDVPAGSLTAVLGPSGCGKTTLLRLIAGFEHADAGRIALDGKALTDERRQLPPERRRIGVVAQEGALFPHLDVTANVGFGLARGARKSRRPEEMLELVGLSGLGRRFPHELSGGQQQRVALARALAPTPAVVLLDEPFTALDAGLRASLRTDVRAALTAAGTTALLVTHDQAEALSLADQVAVMRDGRLAQTADPATLYREPVDADIARFVGDAVLLPAYLDHGKADTPLGPLALRDTGALGPGQVMIRPEQLICEPAPGAFTARVVSSTYYGHDSVLGLMMDSADGGSTPLTARASGGEPASIGSPVAVSVQGTVVGYLD